jgi:hypothetical protein
MAGLEILSKQTGTRTVAFTTNTCMDPSKGNRKTAAAPEPSLDLIMALNVKELSNFRSTDMPKMPAAVMVGSAWRKCGMTKQLADSIFAQMHSSPTHHLSTRLALEVGL